MPMNSLSLLGNTIDAERMHKTVLEALSDSVYFVDRNRCILYWNKAAERLTGHKAEQILGTSCADGILMHVDSDGNCLCTNGCPLAATMQDGNPRDAHVFLHHAEGHRVPVHLRSAAIYGQEGQIVGSVQIFSDDTDRIKTLDRLRELEQAALVDELTRLANRRYFNRAINASLANFARHETPFGVLLLDIDHFKRFNDTYGHDVGDQVLQLVARTLTHSCRAYDTPVRWGGDEFAIISEKVTRKALYATAERIRAMITASFLKQEGKHLSVTVSIGASVVQPNDDADSILQRADGLLYQSKEAGRNGVTI